MAETSNRNKKIQKSKIQRDKLERAIMEVKRKIEKEDNYKFSYTEIDFVLLGLVQKTHEWHLSEQFGD